VHQYRAIIAGGVNNAANWGTIQLYTGTRLTHSKHRCSDKHETHERGTQAKQREIKRDKQKEKMNNHASIKTQVRLTSSMCTDMDQKHGANQHETLMNQAPHAHYNNHETPSYMGQTT